MSKSPMKIRDVEKMVRSTVCIDTPPEGRVAYSLVEKQSKSGLFNNERFLMLNWRQAHILYFDYIPRMPIPVTSLNEIPKPKPKNVVAFKDITYERPKDGLKNRLKITLPADPKGKQLAWLFIMNNKMVDLWLEELDKFKAQQPKNSQEGNKPPEESKVEETKEFKAPGEQPVTPISKLEQQTFPKQPKVEQGSTSQQNAQSGQSGQSGQNQIQNPQNQVQNTQNPQSMQSPQNRQSVENPPNPQNPQNTQNQPAYQNQPPPQPNNSTANNQSPYNQPSSIAQNPQPQTKQPPQYNRQQPSVNQPINQSTIPTNNQTMPTNNQPTSNPYAPPSNNPPQTTKSPYDPPNPRGASFSSNQPTPGVQSTINQPPNQLPNEPFNQSPNQPFNQPPNQPPTQLPSNSNNLLPPVNPQSNQITNSNVKQPVNQSRQSQSSGSQPNPTNSGVQKQTLQTNQTNKTGQSSYQPPTQQTKSPYQPNQPNTQPPKQPNQPSQLSQPDQQPYQYQTQKTQPYQPNVQSSYQPSPPVDSSKHAYNQPKIFNSRMDLERQPSRNVVAQPKQQPYHPKQQPYATYPKQQQYVNQPKQQPYAQQSSRFNKPQLSRSKVQQLQQRPYAQTPLSQPRRNQINYEPPDTYRSDDTYMRQQDDQDKWGQIQNKPEEQRNFPYRVQPQPVTSTFKRQSANPPPQYRATDDNYRNAGYRKPVEEQQYKPNNPYQQPEQLRNQVRQTMFQSMNRETKPNKTEPFNPRMEVRQNSREDVRQNILKEYVDDSRENVRENVRQNYQQNTKQNVYPQESDPQANDSQEWQDPRQTPSRPQQPFFRSTVQTTPPAPSAFQLPQKPAVSNQKNANRFTFSQKDPIYEPSIRSQEQRTKTFNWNTQFYRQNANQISVLRSFKKQAQKLTIAIIDDMTKKDRKYTAITRGRNEIFQHQGLTLVAASHQVNLGRQGVKYDSFAIEALINQFNNYNYILEVTAGQSPIKVPLCAITQYKGIVCFTKADIDTQIEISPAELNSQLTRLQRQTKINRSIFNNNGIFKQSLSNKSIYIDQLNHFLPVDTWQNNRPFNYLAILNSTTILTADNQKHTNSRIQDRSTQKATNELQQINEAVKESAERLLNWFEDFTVSILSHKDIKAQFNRNWLTLQYLPYMYDGTSVVMLKQYFASEMAALVALTLYRNHMQNQIQDIGSNKIKLRDSEVELFLIEQAHNFINQVCSAQNESLGLWKIIQNEVGNRYGASVGQDDIAIGYFLSSFLDKVGLRLNYKDFSTKNRYFQQKDTIRRTFIQGFMIKSKTYNYSYLDTFRKLSQILNEQPSSQGLDTIVEALNLNQDAFAQDTPQLEQLRVYMANFVPPDFVQSKQFTHLNLYEDIYLLPPSAYSIKLMLMACKWAIKLKQQAKAFQLFQRATEDIAFWGGQYHPLQTQFFDFFSQVHLSIGEYDEAIDLAKSSLVNTIKIVGSGRLPVAQKFYQLGNCFFKAGRKQDALTNYNKTKDILQANRKNQTKQFGLVLMKIVTLQLNLGHINQAIEYGLTCLGIFEREPGGQRQLVQSLELLARAYEITQKSDRLTQLTSLCSQRLKNCDDPKIFERMLKVAVYPQLTDLPPNTVKHLLYLVEELSEIRPNSSHNKAFNYILKRSKRENVCQTLLGYIDRLDRLFGQISQSDLLKKYKGFDDVARSDAQDFLCLFDAVTCLIDDNYVIGILREYEY